MTADQVGLCEAVGRVYHDVKTVSLVMGNVSLLFVSNRDSVATPRAKSGASERLTTAKQTARKVVPGSTGGDSQQG